MYKPACALHSTNAAIACYEMAIVLMGELQGNCSNGSKINAVNYFEK
jgi:hypothetical protein